MKPHPRPLLLALALGLTAAVSAHAITPATPPRVPGQVSNVAWEEDMRAFARADQALYDAKMRGRNCLSG